MKPTRSLGVLALALAAGVPAPAAAQVGAPPQPAPQAAATPPQNWWLLDDSTDHYRGTSTDRAYRELLANKRPARQVVVAVIDGGVDVEHEDLKDVIWTNPREIPGNGKDDDNNGYVDDVHGWNFIGGRDGRNVHQDTYEVTRLYGRLNPVYGNANPDTLKGAAKTEYELYRVVKGEYEPTVAAQRQELQQVEQIAVAVQRMSALLKQQVGSDSLTADRVRTVQSTDPTVMQAKAAFLELAENGYTPADVLAEVQSSREALDTKYNPAFNPRTIVGDNPANLAERGYGNPDVEGPDATHGSHVAGIVAAHRGNGIGVDGMAPPEGVRIMVLRVVPDGDERDKDVANAIRYAADNGAQIINMSFGKGFSPNKRLVDEAVRYADSKGVLMVHAAGNDGSNLDVSRNFPNQMYEGGGRPRNWIEVGASHWSRPDSLAASFSNYSKTRVDVFAPGTKIYSTVPQSEYQYLQGTSMASPVVSGLAALLMAYYPTLDAAQVRQIILDSSVRYPSQTVAVPGGEKGQTARFGDLSSTGGIVNTYRAVQLAEQRTGGARR